MMFTRLSCFLAMMNDYCSVAGVFQVNITVVLDYELLVVVFEYFFLSWTSFLEGFV